MVFLMETKKETKKSPLMLIQRNNLAPLPEYVFKHSRGDNFDSILLRLTI